MALVLKDRVKETTTTEGTGAYTLAGAVTGFEAFSAIGDGNTTYYCCTDGTDFEIGVGTYTASGTTLARTTILQSSNSDAAVNWTSGSRTIFCTQPADKAVFLNADGDIEFDNTHRIKVQSDGTDAVLDISGSGPNFIRFRPGIGYSDTENGVDIKYRTSPDDLLIERSQNNKIIAEFGGDDGHAALYYDGNYRLETTSTGVTIHSADGNASPMPDLSLYRNSTTPAASDDLGEITFDGNNDAAEKIEYARIDARAADVADGTEDGVLDLTVMKNGAATLYQRMSYGQAQFYQDIALGTNRSIIFEGDNYNDNEISLTAADPTNDRTITLPDASGTVALTSDLGTIASQAANSVDIDGGAIDGVTLGTNTAITEAQIDDININDGTIESSNSFSGLVLKVNGQLIARVQSPNQTLTGGGLYLYQNNPYITFEGNTADVYETNLKVTDPTANRDITLPDATGTVAVFSTAPTSAIADGSSGQVLTTDGSGGLSFQPVSGGGGSGISTGKAIAMAMIFG